MGAFEPINRIFEPIVAPLRYMPISAFIPLLILWFGIYEQQKIAFLFLGVFVYLLPVVVSAIRSVPEELVQTSLTLGASRMTVFRRVTVPLIAPSLVAGAVLCWARALGEFGATITFAGSFPGRTQTMPLAVYEALETDPPAAIVLSLVLLSVCVIVLALLRERWLNPTASPP